MPTDVRYINEVQADGETALTGPSRTLWKNAPKISEMLDDPEMGYFIWDNFTNMTYCATAATGLGIRNGYPVIGTNATMNQAAAKGGGIVLFTTTDNEECGLCTGGTAAGPFIIPATSVAEGELWFEASVKKLLITDDKFGFFVGLGGAGAAAAGFLAETDVADVDLLGFWNLEAGHVIDAVCQKTSAAFDTILDDCHTLVADTFVKLGFHYDPHANDAEKISFWVDGVEQTTYVGEDSGDATVYLGDTTNFPGGEGMSPIIWMEGAHADDATLTMAWWKCIQLTENN